MVRNVAICKRRQKEYEKHWLLRNCTQKRIEYVKLCAITSDHMITELIVVGAMVANIMTRYPVVLLSLVVRMRGSGQSYS